jgi:putative tricarboxylic transport membrane protein
MADIARIKHVIPYIAVGTAAGYLYYVAVNIQYHARSGVLGPDFWPKAILLLAIAACIYEIGKTLFFGGRGAGAGGMLEDFVEESAAPGSDASTTGPAEYHPCLLLAGMALTAFYVFSIQTLGFFLATAPYLAIFVALGGYRRWGVNAAVSLIGTLAMMFFFMKVVYVSLPIGREPFSQVTIFLMQVMGIR